MKSKVYLIKTADTEKRASSLLKLLHTTDPFSAYKKDEFIPVKLTIGDTKCIYNIRPELVKILISEIKNKKARPFLFDTNVIYNGMRMNAVDHLTLAQNKGFAHSRTGAPYIIADGIFGQDGKEYEVASEYINKVKIPSFIGMVDSLTVLSHVTSHILSGYAGSIKQIAMGMVSRPTKQAQHSSLKPHTIESKCTSCVCCIEICPVNAISLRHYEESAEGPMLRREANGQRLPAIAGSNLKKAYIDPSRCIGCGECLCACKFDAIFINWDEDTDIFCKRMVDVAQFILSKFKNTFFINFAFDITKGCDCISTKDEKIISEDIGILASDDIVSLDRATADMVNKPELKNACKTMLEYAHKKGLGNLEYDLVEI